MEVLEENWEIVQVFQRCSQQYVSSMAGAFAVGLTALEIDAACNLCGIAPTLRGELSHHVQQMGVYAAKLLNERPA